MQNEALTEEQRRFAEDNHNLIYSFLRRYGLCFEDWYDVAAIGYCRAIKDFDPKRNMALSTFAYRVMLNDVRMEMRKAQNTKRKATLVSLHSEVCDGCFLTDVLSSSEPSAEDSSMLAITEYIRAMRTDHQRIIALMVAGKSQREIACRMHTTQPKISRVIKKIRERFRNGFLNENSRAGETPARCAQASKEGADHV